MVTTFAVVWIEIYTPFQQLLLFESPPSRWCGLKFRHMTMEFTTGLVTTFAVVWIEIFVQPLRLSGRFVTTFAVVWIEIVIICRCDNKICVTTFAVVWIEIEKAHDVELCGLSPPSRWCGLKLKVI